MEIYIEYILLSLGLFIFIGIPIIIYCFDCCCYKTNKTNLESSPLIHKI